MSSDQLVNHFIDTFSINAVVPILHGLPISRGLRQLNVACHLTVGWGDEGTPTQSSPPSNVGVRTSPQPIAGFTYLRGLLGISAEKYLQHAWGIVPIPTKLSVSQSQALGAYDCGKSFRPGLV